MLHSCILVTSLCSSLDSSSYFFDFIQILGNDATIKEVTSPSGHSTAVDVYPIGIDPKELLSLAQSPSIQQRVQELKKSFAGKKIIVARDRLEKSNGISLPLSIHQLAKN